MENDLDIIDSKETEFDAIIFMPVGTSFLTQRKSGKKKIRDIEKALDIEKEIELKLKYEVAECKALGSLETIFDKGDRENDKHPAEISSLYGFWYDRWKNQEPDDSSGKSKKKVKIYLLHSENGVGRFCAEGVNQLILDTDYFKAKNVEWSPKLHKLTGLDPKKADGFYTALDDLAEVISEIINKFSGEIFVNITGGYKPLGNYITMMTMALGKRIKVFYLYEKSPKIHYLPSYPLAFDMLEWRDWRGMLLPFTHDGLLNSGQKHDLFKALESTKVGNFLMPPKGGDESKETVKLNSVGTIISRLYEKQDETVSEFGSGGLLLGKFKNSKYADYLRKFCIPRWRHLAVGDHIPETVEHGRGHIQRLLELAQQLLTALGENFLKDEQLFVLISSIWLHDLGHSGNEFTFQGKEGLFTDKNNPESKEPFFIYDEPEKVRKYHNFLSYELITKEKDFLFSLRDGGETAGIENLDELINSTAVAALYHRRAMPVKKIGADSKKTSTSKQCRINWGINDFADTNSIDKFHLIKDLPRIIALLRFLDGAENQSERSGSKESFKVTRWVIERQVKSMEEMRKLKSKKDEEGQQTTLYFDSKRLDKKIDFKKEQPAHYEKHQLVNHVFIVPETETDKLDKKYIYPQEADEKNTLVGVYIVANSDEFDDLEIKSESSEKDSEKLLTLKNEIIKGFYDEFKLVEELLPFKMVLFYVSKLENGEGSQKLSKQQILIEDPPIRFSGPITVE